MKTFSTQIVSLLLILALLPSAVSGQTVQQQQSQYPKLELPQFPNLEDDPGFKRLPPEEQEWVNGMMTRLHTAIEQRDINAIVQIKLDATRRHLMGMTLCGHLADGGTFVDAANFNPSQEEAIAMRWLDPKGSTVHSAIVTGAKRCVVKDGDEVDGKLIARVIPDSVVVSAKHALTAYEAEFFNSPSEKAKGGASHRGLFIENGLAAELDPHKAKASNSLNVRDEDRDFWWNDEKETVVLRPGVVLASVPAGATAPTPASTRPVGQAAPLAAVAPACESPKQLSVWEKLKEKAKKHAEQTAEAQAGRADAAIGKDTKGNVDIGAKDTTTAAVTDGSQAKPACVPAKGQAAKQ